MSSRKLPVIIAVQLDAADAEEAISLLSALLAKEGYVDQEYGDAVIARERIFPTGLPTDPPVALPHTDPDHVQQAAVAAGIFKTPVPFHEMGNPEQNLPVRLVFLLALARKEEAVPLLRQLTLAFRDHEHLRGLQEVSTHQQAKSILAELLGQPPEESSSGFVFELR